MCTCSSRAASKEKIWSKIKHVSVVYCLCLVPEKVGKEPHLLSKEVEKEVVRSKPMQIVQGAKSEARVESSN